MSFLEVRIDLEPLEGNPHDVARIFESLVRTLHAGQFGLDLRTVPPKDEETAAILSDGENQTGVVHVVYEPYEPYKTKVKTHYREKLSGERIKEH